MKYVDEFRDGELARAIAARIGEAADPGRTYHFMEFCGGHTHAISRYGVKDLLPANVVMVHGPGCPVCVLPIGRIDMAIELALGPLTPDPSPAGGRGENVTLCTYADVMRVPASNGLSLMKAKARGADIRMVYS
ncbi:MAG TPA: hydrogenase formation protein HypD, partial [Usitatibacteraceae bacterium]|nr:hydrogenase formation protein HypD [Usitatibacteraceae bacterium]